MDIFKNLLLQNPSAGGGGAATWGSITGTLSSQTDLQTALNAKAPSTTGTAILYGNGSGGFSSVTVGSGLSFAAGTLSSTVSAAWGSITGTLSSQTDLQNALNAKANLSGATFTGGLVSTLGAITTSTPMLSGTQQWNSGTTTFTGLSLNVTDTASAAGSLLADLQIGGVSKFSVRKDGRVSLVYAGSNIPSLYFSTSTWGIYDDTGGSNGISIRNSAWTSQAGFRDGVFSVSNPMLIGWASYPNSQTPDTAFARNAAGVIEINNGTAGTFRDLTLRSLLPASGTITADTPLISGTQTWNNSGVTFTAAKLNVADTLSGANSLLLDLQRNGVSQFKVTKTGAIYIIPTGGSILPGIVSKSFSIYDTDQGQYGFGIRVSNIDFGFSAGGALVNSACFWGWADQPFNQNPNTAIYRDAANIVAQRNGTNANTFRVYNTYTSATNYERLGLNWATNVAQIYTEKGSGGGTARDLVLGTNATTAITISGTDQSVTTAAALSDSIGNVRSIPQNAQTAAYVLAATDNGKHISITTGGVTVNSGIFSAGQVVTIYNNSASNQTITQGTSVTMYQAGTTNTGNRTLASYGVATVLCVASNTFVITGSGLS